MKYKDLEGDVVEAFQFDETNPPKGAFKTTVKDKEREFDPVKGTESFADVEKEKWFIPTKDPHGDINVDGPNVSIDQGVWVLTHEDGTVSLCHNDVFENQYTKVSK